MSLLEKIDPPEGDEAGGEGRDLVLSHGQGLSFADRIASAVAGLMWLAPFQGIRLRGRAPLRLLAVPKDPVAGDKAAGEALLHGRLTRRGLDFPLGEVDFADGPADLLAHLHSFAWLRDLAAAATRERGAKVAEKLMQRWLAAHAETVAEPAWRPDLWGRRLLFWTAYAPYILSSRDAAYRAQVLGTMARGARHIDRHSDRMRAGLPQVAARAGGIAGALLLQGSPGGGAARAEAALLRALGHALHDDGGLISRSPGEQLELVELLAQLRAVYFAADRPLPAAVSEALSAAASALQGTTLGDGALSSWQGGNMASAKRIAAAIEGSGMRTRPLSQPRGWGYQRIEAKGTVVLFDAAPPPPARALSGGCASTLAFEMAEGPNRLVVNCGGPAPATDALPEALVQALRSTAAHSTLTVGDRNSTAILADGTLGKGVGQVDLLRDEASGIVQAEGSHDGYVRRFGLVHQRHLALTADGRELRGEDVLKLEGRRRRGEPLAFAVRFHLGPDVEAATTADGQGALLRVRGRTVWQFRCRGGRLAIEDSLWIDGEARPHETSQLVIGGDCPDDGATIGWVFRRA